MINIAITPGEPAGIGPDLCVQLAQRSHQCQLVYICDPQLLSERAEILGAPLQIRYYHPPAVSASEAGIATVLPLEMAESARCGVLHKGNAQYVLDTLRQSVMGCLRKEFDALVTGPVHKGIINEAGIAFSGHTEFLQALTNASDVVMMLMSEHMKVALVTTHIALAQVSSMLTQDRLERVITVLQRDLKRKFGIGSPRILVAGLNPHAGESGHMGREEIDIIEPVLQRLRKQGLQLKGPLPADTLFTPSVLAQGDVALAMFHDQGLPVLKYQGFGNAVNITLGLPIIRTSVDHGTALDLAGSGKADGGSLKAALQCAMDMVDAAQSASQKAANLCG